jgi:hypothetical protein
MTPVGHAGSFKAEAGVETQHTLRAQPHRRNRSELPVPSAARSLRVSSDVGPRRSLFGGSCFAPTNRCTQTRRASR